MKKVNFDALSHIKAPQTWIEKAELIPEMPQKKAPVAVPYRAVAAAALVLVSVAAVVVFLMFEKPSPVNDGSLPISQTESETSISTAQRYSEASETDVSDMFKKFPETENNTVSSEAETISVSLSTAPTAVSTEQRQAATASATEPAAVTTPSYTRETTETRSPETQPQTTPIIPTDPPYTPTEITDPTYGFEELDVVSVAAVFPSSLITDGEPIYCIVQRRGYAAGSIVKDRFADYRRAHYTVMKNGNVFAGYDEKIDRSDLHGEVTYDYFFYNSRGEVLVRDYTTVYL